MKPDECPIGTSPVVQTNKQPTFDEWTHILNLTSKLSALRAAINMAISVLPEDESEIIDGVIKGLTRALDDSK